MRTRMFVTWSLLPMLAIVISAQSAAAQGQPIAEVRGHGTDYFFPRKDDGVLMDQISIDAWLDEDGNAHGTMSWTSVYLGFEDPGPTGSGYPWYMVVTDLLVVDNLAIVQGIVVSSPQAPDDVGSPVRFTVVDNGNGANDPPDELGVNFGAPSPVLLGNFTVRSAGDRTPAHEVVGHGIWSQVVGAGEDLAQWIDQVSINAWVDDAGTAHGSIVWTSVFHQLPADPDAPLYDAPGPAGSGYPWYLEVTSVSVFGNEAYVYGIVVHSPQVPEDEGSTVTFHVVDRGNGPDDPPDLLGGREIEGGNFTVR